MGLFSARKKSNKTATVDAVVQTENVSIKADAADSSSGKKKGNKWSPMRKKASNSKNRSGATNDTSPSLVSSLSRVVANENIEVMTPETRRAFLEQREAIRRKLFNPEGETTLTRANTTPNTPTSNLWRSKSISSAPLTADKASLPMSMVSPSWDAGSTILETLDEASVEFSLEDSKLYVPKQKGITRPLSVDISYTESELESSIEATPKRTGSKVTDQEVLIRSSSVASQPVSVDISYTESELASVASTQVQTASSLPTSLTTIAAIVSPPILLNTGKYNQQEPANINNNNYAQRSGVTGALYTGTRTLKGPTGTPNDSLDDILLTNKSDQSGPLKPPKSPNPENVADTFTGDTVTPMVTNRKINAAFYPMDKMVPLEWQNPPLDKSCTDKENVEEKSDQNSLSVTGASLTSYSTTNTANTQSVPEAARQLVAAAMHCADAALMVDKGAVMMCDGAIDIQPNDSVSVSTTVAKRPVFLDEDNTLRFIRRLTSNGFILLQLQPPSDEQDEWNGRTITMMIQKGQAHDSDETNFHRPQLQWSSVIGGRVNVATTTSIDLMDVIAINCDVEGLDDFVEDDMCFFTITTVGGDIHVFETAHVEERDRIVSGLKTLIARLAYHLIAGDTTAVAELFHSQQITPVRDPKEGTLHSLPNTSHTMNRLAHVLLDESE